MKNKYILKKKKDFLQTDEGRKTAKGHEQAMLVSSLKS